MSNSKTKRMVGIAMLASVAFVISQFSFPILPAVPFLKIDFSDVPVMIGMYMYGPGRGILIAFLRSLIHYAQTGGEAGIPIGDAAAFIASVSYTLPLYFLLKKQGTSFKNKVIASAAGTLTLTVVLSLLNWVVLAPLYMALMNFDVGPMREYLLLAVIPFNLLKGPIVAAAFFAVSAKLYPWIAKNKKRFGISQKERIA